MNAEERREHVDRLQCLIRKRADLRQQIERLDEEFKSIEVSLTYATQGDEPSGELVTHIVAADMLGMTRATITKWCRDGKMKARPSGKIWYVTLAEVERHRRRQ